MELKFVRVGCEIYTADRFNRTFMELKWRGFGVRVSLTSRFNRTFMELKFYPVAITNFSGVGLIVPLWNWNQPHVAVAANKILV